MALEDEEADAQKCAEREQALLRNDRYLTEFVESLAICPYAKTCRDTGRLHREVELGNEPQAQEVAARILALEDEAPDIEVALIIFPRVRLLAPAFERFVAEVGRRYKNLREAKQQAQSHGAEPRPLTAGFFVVAFHPELGRALHNADVAVRFMRRSPDPTIQLVRPEAIMRVRGARDAESLSRHIAEAGLRAVLSAGPEKLYTLLEDIGASYR